MDLVEFFRIGMDRVVGPLHDPPKDGYRINLGIAPKKMPEGVHSIGLPDWNAEYEPIPYDDRSVAEIWALHFLEHIDNIFFLLAECHRVLRPGGTFNITVPYGTCHMAMQDLGHRHYFNESTWDHAFDNPYYDQHGTANDWLWIVTTNVIMGVKGENLALMTQIVKVA